MDEREDFELFLDAMEISRLHQMDEAAKIMDAHDKEDEHGNQDQTSRLG